MTWTWFCTCTMTTTDPCPLHTRRVLKTYPGVGVVEVMEPLLYDECYDVALQLERERRRRDLEAHGDPHWYRRYGRRARKR